MAGTPRDKALFVGFALGVQVVLVVFFAARKWKFRLVERYGWLVLSHSVTDG